MTAAHVIEALIAKENIVHIAAALYLAGFLFRNQIMLRSLIVVGDLVYILYFFFAPELPLWGGIFWSAIFMLVNLWMIARTIADQSDGGMTDEDRLLFQLLDNLTPGEFRRLIRAGSWRAADAAVVITEENQLLDRLYYVVEGGILIEKRGHRMAIPSRTFIGEIAFLLSEPASATVTLAKGAIYMTWDTHTLGRLFLRVPSLRIALDSALNKDLARKVARALPLDDLVRRWGSEPPLNGQC